MLRPRIIPSLLYNGAGLVKTVKFKDPTYVGDPMNAISIFNAKGVDELIFLDINATKQKREPDFEMIEQVASRCFMPLCYGGGITRLDHIKRVLTLGVEKVAINSAAADGLDLFRAAADYCGSQSVVGAIDVKRGLLGKYTVHTHGGTKSTGLEPVDHAQALVAAGAGEILINAIDRDGTMQGYDIGLIRRVADAVDVPVIASGGAGGIADLVAAIQDGHASAAAAGALFVFWGKHRAVLINYPDEAAMDAAFAVQSAGKG